jgi:hypothetical protein
METSQRSDVINTAPFILTSISEKQAQGLSKPRNKDKIDKNKLFNNPHAYNAILAFLDATNIGLRVNNNEREEEEVCN